jgi:hypothetical protein
MLNSFERVFDYPAIEKKLRHYFTDAAPIYADIELRMKEVRVTCRGKLTVQVSLDDRIGIKENIYQIIKCCEQSLYPKMLDLPNQAVYFSGDRVKELVIQGFSLEQIHEKEIKKKWNCFTIVRFNTEKNTIDYREEVTGKVFRAHFNRPLIISRDVILRLADGGQDGMRELYRFVTSNSTIVELEAEDVTVPAYTDRY